MLIIPFNLANFPNFCDFVALHFVVHHFFFQFFVGFVGFDAVQALVVEGLSEGDESSLMKIIRATNKDDQTIKIILTSIYPTSQ